MVDLLHDFVVQVHEIVSFSVSKHLERLFDAEIKVVVPFTRLGIRCRCGRLVKLVTGISDLALRHLCRRRKPALHFKKTFFRPIEGLVVRIAAIISCRAKFGVIAIVHT